MRRTVVNNYAAENIFDNMDLWKPEGKYTPLEYNNLNLKDDKGNKITYKIARQNYLNKNKISIDNRPSSPLPVKTMARYYGGAFIGDAIANVEESFNAWKKIGNIIYNDGTIIGWDTETFGDATSPEAIAKNIAGVSELGLAKTIYNNGEVISNNYYSILIKANDEQYKYFKNVIKKIKNHGFESLEEYEIVTAERLSKYRNAKANDPISIDILGNRSFVTVSGLSEYATKNIKDIETGADFLRNHGNNLNEVLDVYTKALAGGIENKTALMAANSSGYDIPVLRALGVSENELNVINKNTGDITMAQRVIAKAFGLTTYELNQEVKGDSQLNYSGGSNTVGAMANSLGYNAGETTDVFHESGWDSKVTTAIGTTKDYLYNQSFAKNVMESFSKLQTLNEYSPAEDSIYFIHSGSFDKQSIDQATMSKETTQSLSIRNKYWGLEKTGWTKFTPEGETQSKDIFVATFKSLATNENGEFSMGFENEEKFAEFVGYKTTAYASGTIPQEDIDAAVEMADRDLARRQYDKFFDANVKKAGWKNDDGGYASLVKYINAYDEIENIFKKENISDINDKMEYLYSHQDVSDPIRKTLTKYDIETYTQYRTFIGMYNKLSDERDVLKDITNYIGNEKYKDANNIQKTHMLKDMYDYVYEQFDTNVINIDDTINRQMTNVTKTLTVNDVFSIDLLGSDGEYHTINASTSNKLQSNITFLYKDAAKKSEAASLEDMKIGVEDLLSRHLITEYDYRDIMKNFDGAPSIFNVSESISIVLNKVFEPFRKHSNPLELYVEKLAQGIAEEKAGGAYRLNTVLQKNVESPLYYSVAKMDGTYKDTFDGFVTLSDYYNKTKNTLESTMQKVGYKTSIQKGQMIYSSNLRLKTENDSISYVLREKLNLSDRQINIVNDLFNATTKEDGKIKSAKYAINNQEYRQKGLTSLLVLPQEEGNSAYVVLTNKTHSTEVINILSDVDKDLYYDEIEELLKGKASFFEIKALHQQPVGKVPDPLQQFYDTDIAVATSVAQGRNVERYVHAGYNFYIDKKDGLIHGRINYAGDDVINAPRRALGNAISNVLDGDFDFATKSFKKAIDEVITAKSGSSSYQGITDDTGERVRGTNWNHSDSAHAGRFLFGTIDDNDKGIGLVMNQLLTIDSPNNPIKQMLSILDEDIKSPGFKDFYDRHLLELTIDNNPRIKNWIQSNPDSTMVPWFRKTIHELVADFALYASNDKELQGHLSKVMGSEVIEALQTMNAISSEFTRNDTENYVIQGYGTYMGAETFSTNAPGSGINRPVNVQKYNVRYMNPNILPKEYLDRIGAVGNKLTTSKAHADFYELDDIVLPDGTVHKDQISDITIAVKQMSDEEFASRLKTVKEGINGYANRSNMDSKLLREAYEAVITANPSIYGDSVAIAPSLATFYYEQSMDTKKVKISDIAYLNDTTKEYNKQYKKITEEILNNLEGQKIDKNTPIGYNGKLIYWSGFETVLTKKNINDLLESGETIITPLNATDSRKFMLGESEKFVANGVIVDDDFLKKHNFKSKEEALSYLDFIFEKLSGAKKGDIYTPAAITNLNVAKHISGTHLNSTLNLIVNEYNKEGKLDFLMKTLNDNGYSHWSPEVFNGTANLHTLDSNYRYDVIKLFKEIQENKIGLPVINRKIIKAYQYFKDKDIFFLGLTNQIQNQIMGESLKLDPRMEAVIRRRNENESILQGGGTIKGKTYESIIMDSIHENVKTGREDYIRASDLSSGKKKLFNQLIERTSKNKNASLIKLRKKVKAQEDVVTGIAESLRYFHTLKMPENIVHYNINDIIKATPAKTKENLKHLFFKPNGKYTKDYMRKAREKGVDLSLGSYTVAVDLDKTFEIALDENQPKIKKEISSILVPLYNIYDDFSETSATKEENINFTKSLKDVNSFFYTYAENINKQDGDAKIIKALQEIAKSYTKELATDDKTSLAYKTAGKIILPNSTYSLAQDEVAAVTEDMLGLAKSEQYIEKQIRNSTDTSESAKLLSELTKAKVAVRNRLDEIANTIQENGGLELYANKLMGKGDYTIAKNGGFINVNAVNRNTFEQRLGFDIGLFGKDLFDNPNGHYMHMGVREFTYDYAKTKAKIVSNIEENLNKMHSFYGIAFTDSYRMNKDINTAIEDTWITIKDLNQNLIDSRAGRAKLSLIEDKFQKAITSSYDFFGERYLKEIGVTTRITVRNPSFGIGIGPANLILDDSVGNSQLRILGPGYSKTMKLDHDGDIMGIAIHNAARAMKKDVLEIRAAMGAIEYNAFEELDIVAQMIREGDAFKKDRPFDLYLNESVVFKSYNKAGYNTAKDEFIKSIGINKDTLIDDIAKDITIKDSQGRDLSLTAKKHYATTYIDESIDYMAAYSTPMRQAIDNYNKTNGNILKEASAIVAASSAKTNKANIGLISNASFALHDSISTVFSQTTDIEMKKRIALLHSQLDYLSEDGMSGLLTIAEQKGIDTKHIYEASDITNVDLFSKGIKNLFTDSKHRIRNTEDSLYKIMWSINHAMFNTSKEETLQIAKEIMKTSFEEYTKLIDEQQIPENALDFIMRRQMRTLYELSNIKEIREQYNSPLRKPGNGVSWEDFVTGIENIRKYSSSGNIAGHMASAVEKTSSNIKIPFNENVLYLGKGTLTNKGYGYILKPHNPNMGQILKKTKDGYELKFKEVLLKDSLPSSGNTASRKNFTGTIYGKTPQEIINKANKLFIKHSSDESFVQIPVRDWIENTDKTKLSKFETSRKQARALNILNGFFIDTLDESKRDKFFTLKKETREKLETDLGKLYSIIDTVAQTDREDLIAAEEFFKFLNDKASPSKKNTWEGFIRSINEDIVKNPDNYANSTEFQSFDDIIKHKLKEQFGGSYDQYTKDFSVLKGFDSIAYDKEIKLLREDIYDIMSERNVLDSAFAKLKQYEKYGIQDITNALKTQEDTVNNVINNLTINQTKKVKAAEQKIYSLFNSEKQLNAKFDWSTANEKSVVGFGEYLGFKFSDLSQRDVTNIFSYAETNAKYYTEQAGALNKYAYEKTLQLLTKWNQSTKTMSPTSIPRSVSSSTKKIIDNIQSLILRGGAIESIKNADNLAAEKAAKELQTKATKSSTASTTSTAQESINKAKPKERMKKNTLHGSFLDSIKGIDIKSKLPTIGVITAGLAAIGVANNLLHNQKNKSPLTPARKPNGNGAPDVNGNYPESAPQQQAPASKQQVVYHDNNSGYNFKVSAKTKNYINDLNNAKLIGTSGGGNASVYSQSDTSGVTDNWLANKFAELT